MQKGDVILVDYTGKDLSSNRVFDTTMAQAAKESALFDERIVYKPVPIILGRHEMLSGLEDEMEQMKVGETKKIVLTPVKAFGERDARNIRIASLKDFVEHKMNPHPGMLVEVNGAQGRVQSVSSGRVRIDFNHPLAGKTLEYEVTIQKKLDALQDQASALFDKFFPFVSEKEKKISEKDGQIQIELPESAKQFRETDVLKQIFEKILIDQLKGVKAVKFIEKNTKPAEKTGKSDATTKEAKPKAAP